MAIQDTDILRVVASLLWTDGEINQNVYNCVVSGGAGPYSDEDVGDDMIDWCENLYANMVGKMSDEIDGNSVTVYKWDSGNEDWDEVTSNAWVFDPNAGTDQLPRAVSALVQLWTEDPDVQGKKYLPGNTEANAENGLWVAGMITSLLGFGADWLTPFVGAGAGATYTPGVWSVVQQAFLAAVDHFSTSTIPAYQRRRKNNVGI
jgi:hypothetical protein